MQSVIGNVGLFIACLALGACWGGNDSATAPQTATPPSPTTPSQPVAPDPIADLKEPVLHPNLPIAAKLLRSGQFVDAQIVLRNILREQPSCARGQFLLGVAVMKLKRYGEARELLEASLASKQDFPERRQVDHFLGWSCYYLGDLDAAKAHFQAHVGAVPTAADSYYGLGVIAIDEDRISDAQSALDRSLELLPQGPRSAGDRSKALARLGDIAVRREDLPLALDLFTQAASLHPDHYEVWGKLARVLDSMGKPAEAHAAREQHDAAMQRTGKSPPEGMPTP